MWLCGSAVAEPSLEHNGTMRWKIDAPWFGGWSGLEISNGGTRMSVISDRGRLLNAVLERSSGRLTGVGVINETRLNSASGARLRKKNSDVEGIAIDSDGTAFVSFEHRHRIMEIDLQNGRTTNQIKLPFANALGANAGVEALAIGPDGTLFAVAEQSPAGDAPFPLYAYASGQWRISAYIPQRGPFLPVGADFDPYGRLWLLERATTPLGFRSRIRMFVLDSSSAREYMLMTSIPARYDNLEGISVWPDPHGQLHVSMISDDNFFRLQRTHIVEYVVQE
jgi:hypothetical protein